ncbi:sigma-70 region 2 family protein [Aspergillus ellipticus CBS 707.79]|uniref:Sigma-70 region 2 family protein n=1 Tax=Aspergillus ellipticus CBS 707.79 TaxID=1448320 RepID=A0A319DN24_9EURO|nr:sigma-70 region 2 family protein [Aspergillus ellipticus CBS 707.79]
MSDETGNTSGNRSTTGSSQMRWQFIDASDNSRRTLTQVKRHVMQEYMRQKRNAAGQPGAEFGDTAPEGGDREQKPRQQSKTSGLAEDARESREEDPYVGDNSHRLEIYPHQHSVQYTDHSPDNYKAIESTEATEAVSYSVTESVNVLPYRDNSSQYVYLSSSNPSEKYPAWSQSSSSDIGTLTPSSSAPTSPADMALSPKTLLSAARTDPFNTLPLDLDLEGQRLFDFYVNEMPACSYGAHFRSRKAHNWYTAVFVPEGMKGSVAFQNTILVHAANTWVWVRNKEPDESALVHRDRAISMLREHREQNPGDISDEMIISCLSAAGLEDFDPRPGRKHISWLHMRAAREMIRARGGPSAFENTRLGMLINWQDYILSGYETDGPSFFFEYAPPTTHLTIAPHAHSLLLDPVSIPETVSYTSSLTELDVIHHSPLSPQEEIRSQCNEFIDFLKRCEQLSIYQRNVIGPARAPIRHVAFRENSLLYQILAAPPGVRFTASGNRKQFVARLVSMMILNAGLWDYRNSVWRSETFLGSLEQAVLDSEVNTSGSVEALLQILLECNDGVTCFFDKTSHLPFQSDVPDFTRYSPTAKTPYGRPWFAGRMLKVAKRLSLDTWMNLNFFLFSCLTLHPGIHSVSLWENDLRQEILTAPLTNYVMPSLQEQ